MIEKKTEQSQTEQVATRSTPKVRDYEVTSSGRVVVDLRELFQSEDVREIYDKAEEVARLQRSTASL